MAMSEQETIQAYPLQWPAGWRRIQADRRKRAGFHDKEPVYRNDPATGRQVLTHYRKAALSIGDSLERVLAELSAMGLGREHIVISTNVPLRQDGLPYSQRISTPKDPGAAVYWKNGKTTRCMAVDRYDRVADNLAAIAATLQAMRAIERHGGAQILDRAFVGFKQLMAPEQWWQVLGLDSPDVTAEKIQDAWLEQAKKHHPDRGGEDAHMARINAARDHGLEEITVGVGR